MAQTRKSPFASKEPKSQIMDITPELAARMLEYNDKNRRMKKENVAAIKESLLAGRFTFTSASIGFDTEGQLCDGQHRLQAIVESGIGVKMAVIFGANQSPYLDRGARRLLADNLKIANGKDFSATIISVINLLWRARTHTHRSLSEDKVGICYELIRQDVESEELAPIFKKSFRKVPAYSSDYMTAILVILISNKFPREKIIEMDKLYRDGYSANPTPSDKVILDQRTDFLAQKGAFSKSLAGPAQAIARCEAFLASMIAYLNGNQRKKSIVEARKFYAEATDPFFEIIEEAFGLPTEKN